MDVPPPLPPLTPSRGTDVSISALLPSLGALPFPTVPPPNHQPPAAQAPSCQPWGGEGWFLCSLRKGVEWPHAEAPAVEEGAAWAWLASLRPKRASAPTWETPPRPQSGPLSPEEARWLFTALPANTLGFAKSPSDLVEWLLLAAWVAPEINRNGQGFKACSFLITSMDLFYIMQIVSLTRLSLEIILCLVLKMDCKMRPASWLGERGSLGRWETPMGDPAGGRLKVFRGVRGEGCASQIFSVTETRTSCMQGRGPTALAGSATVIASLCPSSGTTRAKEEAAPPASGPTVQLPGISVARAALSGSLQETLPLGSPGQKGGGSCQPAFGRRQHMRAESEPVQP